jgi:hypothetical protein
MKGEIVNGTKSSAFDLDEHVVEKAWGSLDDGLTVEIVWEALDLIGLYILLRIMQHVLLAVEYISLEVGTSPLNLIEQKFVQNENNLLEEGKSRLWQIFNVYHISKGTVIKVYRQLSTESKKDIGLYGNFVIESDSTLNRPLVPHLTETFTSSYCC